MERRTFLSAGSISALALAAGYTDGSGATRSDGPTESVTEYYRRATAAETADAFAAAIPELAHSASPLLDLAEDTPEAFGGTVQQNLLDTDVIEEDLSADAIRGLSEFFAGSVSDDAVARLAARNAVVAATLESDSVLGGELAVEWLVAPEDGEWRVVWPTSRNSPGAAARRFFREVSQTEFAGQLEEPVAELTHSSSPLVNIADYNPWYFRGLRRQELAQTEVVAQNVGVGRIASRFGPLVSWASKGEIEAIAEENAVVAVSLSDDQLDSGEFDQQWLVAPDSGEWRVVWF